MGIVVPLANRVVEWSMKDASRSAATRLAIALRKIEKTGNQRALEAFLVSPGYRAALAALADPGDKHMVFRAQSDAITACFRSNEVPARGSMRVRWSPERIADLKRAARKHGADFTALALHMAIPQEAARRAYYRYVKVESATAA